MKLVAGTRSRAHRAGIVVVVALALTVAGCGSDDDGATQTDRTSSTDDRNADTVAVTDDTNDTDVNTDGSGGEVDLGDFPVPAPPGGEVIVSASGGGPVLIVYPVTEYDAIVDFYQEWAETAASAEEGPPTITADEADRQFGAALLATDIGLVQLSVDEQDGELGLTIGVVATEQTGHAPPSTHEIVVHVPTMNVISTTGWRVLGVAWASRAMGSDAAYASGSTPTGRPRNTGDRSRPKSFI